MSADCCCYNYSVGTKHLELEADFWCMYSSAVLKGSRIKLLFPPKLSVHPTSPQGPSRSFFQRREISTAVQVIFARGIPQGSVAIVLPMKRNIYQVLVQLIFPRGRKLRGQRSLVLRFVPENNYGVGLSCALCMCVLAFGVHCFFTLRTRPLFIGRPGGLVV